MTFYTGDYDTTITPSLDNLPAMHVNLSQDLFAGIMIVFLIASLIYTLFKIKNKKLSYFKTIYQKIGLILFICANVVLLSIIGYILFTNGFFAKYRYSGNQIIDYFEWSLKYSHNIIVLFGIYGILLSLFLIFLYDKTIGRIVNWIKSPR